MKLRSQSREHQRRIIGYSLPAKDFTDYKEVSKFGGEMMQASLTSLERAASLNADGSSTSLNAYITTASGKQVQADLGQLWRKQGDARHEANYTLC